MSDIDTESQDALAAVDTLLDRFTHFGVELGLERIQRLLADLGNPQQQVSIIHVAGSNGKGSVCACLSSVLAEAGYRIGRYTSPHLVSWCERICLNQQKISPAELYQLLQQVLAAIRPDRPSPTQFEVITAAAWLYFAQQQVDMAVVEVGLGGRLDATNVCDRPLVSIITSLSREHWQKLGPTLADITREKAGILKPNCPAVIAPQPPEATMVLQQRLSEMHCPVIWVQSARDLGYGWAEVTTTDVTHVTSKADESDLFPPLFIPSPPPLPSSPPHPPIQYP
ncbi:MAG: bifunctional folylpolyglutamate synthase/dihydrofolate synthase, partial [Cyanobacteria bacterium CRU_2_1]|nr:bifunctional folylpolyglutamate synthase/dihydrofolate synthase [Cyanobacteria bacterium CRU_2_1]